MRWICTEDIEECLTKEWRVKAESLTNELIAAPDNTARKKILKKSSSTDVWRDFYALLPDQLKKKCWYCESEEIRSDMAIDHFRPKNRVEGEKQHDGYWWLAFDWKNYRCACTFCNSQRNFEETQGGKACKFPLENPESRVFSYQDDDQICNELPNFLDPFNLDDEKLLWFDSDGLPEPKPDADDKQKIKVKNSIDIFHLHEKRIARLRKQICIEINKQVKKIRDNDDVLNAKNTLKRMVRDTEKFSRAAVVYLRAHRDLLEVREILNLD